jgi:hypothetical protein
MKSLMMANTGRNMYGNLCIHNKLVTSEGMYTGRIFTLLTGSTALRFTATGVPLADESARLTADNVRNEVVTIHRSQ